MASPSSTRYAERFSAYFQRDAAKKAANPLSNGAEIELVIVEPKDFDPQETLTFTKEKGQNKIVAGAARSPQIRFLITLAAADQILDDPTNDIGAIGVNIMKMMLQKDSDKQVGIEFKAGFLSLMTKGYLGVIATGGTSFASYLASRGLGGASAIKAALAKMKKD